MHDSRYDIDAHNFILVTMDQEIVSVITFWFLIVAVTFLHLGSFVSEDPESLPHHSGSKKSVCRVLGILPKYEQFLRQMMMRRLEILQTWALVPWIIGAWFEMWHRCAQSDYQWCMNPQNEITCISNYWLFSFWYSLQILLSPRWPRITCASFGIYKICVPCAWDLAQVWIILEQC